MAVDWDDLRVFGALAEAATFRAAASALGISHTTFARRLEGLEIRLGAKLVHRGKRGVQLTEAGAILLRSVEEASAAVDTGLRQVTGADRRMEGPIRVTLPDFLAFYCLLGPLHAFQTDHPGITLEVEISYASADLARREADVAVRMTDIGESPPETLVGRKVGQSWATGYATPAYLDRVDLSDSAGGGGWLGWAPGAPQEWTAGTPYPDLPVRGAFNHAELQHHAALAGLGMAYIPCLIGDSDPGLVRVPGMVPKPARDIWVLTHEDLRETARMREMRACVTDALIADAPALRGEATPLR